MMFIHGGNFVQGGASTILYNADYIANTTQTIVAVIQYRLGAEMLHRSCSSEEKRVITPSPIFVVFNFLFYLIRGGDHPGVSITDGYF